MIISKKATIYDVAKLAGTSTATVSRILNNTGYPVSEELKNRVLNAVTRLDYSPNLMGRQLKTNKNNDIAVIIPNISNQYYPLLLSGIENIARKNGYSVLVCNSNRDIENEKKYLDTLYQKQVKGIIISSTSENPEYLVNIQNKGVNIVAFDQDIPIPCSKINFNYYEGAYLATNHLIKLGHKNIGFVGSPLIKYSRKEIFKGFKTALMDNSIPIQNDFIYIFDNESETYDQIYEFKNGELMAQKAVKTKNLPTAFFCVNDMTAFGVIKGLSKNNIKVPYDISIIGFDNIPTSEIINPALTTIDQKTYEMGSLAAETLIDILENNHRKTISKLLQPSLVIRETDKKID